MHIQLHELDRKAYNGRQAPAYLTALITKIGGTNFYGEPNFRLVWASERLTPSGGTWVDWDKNLSTKDRQERRGNKPIRRVAEVRMIRRYGPAQGWLLEKWCPPSIYGSPRRWYSPVIIGGTMILVDGGTRRLPSQGSYPSRGDYEYTGFGFTTEELSEGTVIQGVQQILRGIQDLPTAPYSRLWERAAVANKAQEVIDRSYESWAMDVLSGTDMAFHGAPMAGYGKKGAPSINTTLKKLGISSHAHD